MEAVVEPMRAEAGSEFGDNAPARDLDVTVLCGGPGAERDVSLNSGRAVAAALRRMGHRVKLDDVRPDDISALDRPGIDLAFIALHGTWGEDGRLQGVLDERGVPYCGSGPEASALAMDKARAKERCRRIGVPTPEWVVIDGAGAFDELEPRAGSGRVVGQWAPPAVVKPVAEGSSVDCYIARDPETLEDRVRHVAGVHGACMIEEYVEGLELTVGIVGGRALPAIEIRTKRDFYDYEAKYLDDDTEYLFEIDLPAGVLARLAEQSLAVFEALGCRDFGRVDWMVPRPGDAVPQFLEVNTIPGFTDHSLLPKAAAEAGLDFDRLCQRIVELAWARTIAWRRDSNGC